jgi:hypothetical protein
MDEPEKKQRIKKLESLIEVVHCIMSDVPISEDFIREYQGWLEEYKTLTGKDMLG